MISATPERYVQKTSLGGNHGGTMSLKKSGFVKWVMPANSRNAPNTGAARCSQVVGGVSFMMLTNLSSTLANLNFYRTAETYAERCAALWPDEVFAVVNLASTKGLLNKLDEAEAGFRRAMDLEPGNVKHPYMLAIVLLQKGRNEEAQAVLDQALRLLPAEDDWREGHQMVRRILLRQEPLPDLATQKPFLTDGDASEDQRGPK